jgi:type IV pilus assembly protein PilN
MTAPSWLVSDWDLLRQRRVERGLPAQASPFPAARGLVLRGVAFGGGLIAAVVGGWLWIGLRQGQVDAALQGARGIPAQVQSLESQAQRRRRDLSVLNRSTEGLAQGLVAVSSGSALLTQLMTITPAGVQLTDVRVQGMGLSLSGVAADPQAFRRVNAMSLSLARSPLFQPGSIKVVKLSRDGTEAKPGEPVAWQLKAGFAALAAGQQLQLLQQLGADGMARRLQILQRAGLLP